jgi:hypothetical protein
MQYSSKTSLQLASLMANKFTKVTWTPKIVANSQNSTKIWGQRTGKYWGLSFQKLNNPSPTPPSLQVTVIPKVALQKVMLEFWQLTTSLILSFGNELRQ